MLKLRYFLPVMFNGFLLLFARCYSLEDVDTHKVRRQESVRRREEQIKSLEISKSKYVDVHLFYDVFVS